MRLSEQLLKWLGVLLPHQCCIALQVLLITTHRFVYVKPVKKIVKWVIDGTHIISVGTIDFDISIQCKYAHSRKSSTMIKMVSRKRIVCTTSDMQHFILVKIDCHLERMRLALREQAGDETNHGVGTSSRMEVSTFVCTCLPRDRASSIAFTGQNKLQQVVGCLRAK